MSVTGLRRREIVLAITIIATLAILIDYFTTIDVQVGTWQTWGTVIMAFTMALAVISVYRLHVTYIQRREPGQWAFSVWLIIMLTLTIILGLIGFFTSPSLDPMDLPAYAFLLNNITAPLDATQYGMTGFFIVSALYRAFRARTKEASILVVCACFLILFNSSFAVVSIPVLGDIGAWLLAYPGTGGARGMLIASGAGMLGLSLRLISGRERGYAAE